MQRKIGVLGLGYVGLPLAVEFGKAITTVGFDINTERIKELKKCNDFTREISSEELKLAQSKNLKITSDISDLRECDFFIITVPTPVNQQNNPDLNPLIKASETIGRLLKKGDIVVYESTVFPGCTEEICIPILEKHSNLIFNRDFYCGYSPERINPGDKERTLTKITKITSGSNPQIAEVIDYTYRTIITAGTFKAKSIKVAEAAKVIENAQRDINIAFTNELSKIFSLIGINTLDVLEAAETKWNFLPFKPGLVGGHCIGVDPYYLAAKATELGYHPEIILAGRRINDSMATHVGRGFIEALIRKKVNITSCKTLIVGLTFKENCPDIRNTKVIDVYNYLAGLGVNVEIFDNWANREEVEEEYGITIKTKFNELENTYEGIILAVPHREVLNFDWPRKFDKSVVFYDLKGAISKKFTL